MLSPVYHEIHYEQNNGNTRDVLAESFVSSFLCLQREVANSVEKGLSRTFDLDAYMRQCQSEIDGIMHKLVGSSDEAERKILNVRLETFLDGMCEAQSRTNLMWNHIDEQINEALGETEGCWKKAETFFRSKQKRGELRNNQPADSRGKARKVQPSANSVKPNNNGHRTNSVEIVRPSLLPKRPNGSSIIRKAKSSAVLEASRKMDRLSSVQESRERSFTPENRSIPTDRRPKVLVAVARKVEKKMDVTVKSKEIKEKDRQRQKSPIKKRRTGKSNPRSQKRGARDDTDDSPSDDSKDSSDPPYKGPSEAAKKDSDTDKAGNSRRNDPDEIRYCVCRNISYGNMVGCDNEVCVIEWFHFDCVGLKAKPRGKWFCPDCRDGQNSKLSKTQLVPDGRPENDRVS